MQILIYTKRHLFKRAKNQVVLFLTNYMKFYIENSLVFKNECKQVGIKICHHIKYGI